MIADNLSAEIWNAIADLVARSKAARQIYFAKVTKADKVAKIIWADEFGDIGIPLVSHRYSFSHYDTVPFGNVTSGQPAPTQLQRREDKTQNNPAYQVEMIVPRKGDTVVILDALGSRRFPICIGTVISRSGYWNE